MSLLDSPRTFTKYNPVTGVTATRTAYTSAEVVRLEFDGWREVPKTQPRTADQVSTEQQTKPAGKPISSSKS